MKKKLLSLSLIVLMLVCLNGCVSSAKLSPPTYSTNQGTYDSVQKIKINKPEGNEVIVYYTLDGTDPTKDSNKYDGKEITIDKTTTIRSIAIDSKNNTSDVSVAKYEINIPSAKTTEEPKVENNTKTVTETNSYEHIGDISGRYMTNSSNPNVQIFLDPGNSYFEYYKDDGYYCKGKVEYIFHDTNHPMIEMRDIDTTSNLDFTVDVFQILTSTPGDGIIELTNHNGTQSTKFYYQDDNHIDM